MLGPKFVAGDAKQVRIEVTVTPDGPAEPVAPAGPAGPAAPAEPAHAESVVATANSNTQCIVLSWSMLAPFAWITGSVVSFIGSGAVSKSAAAGKVESCAYTIYQHIVPSAQWAYAPGVPPV
jgi:hypothetical protein